MLHRNSNFKILTFLATFLLFSGCSKQGSWGAPGNPLHNPPLTQNPGQCVSREAVVPPCCQTTPSGQRRTQDDPLVRHSRTQDPYQSGVLSNVNGVIIHDSLTARVSLRSGVDYRFNPQALGTTEPLPPCFFIPTPSPHETDSQYILRRAESVFGAPRSPINYSHFVSLIGIGGASTVAKINIHPSNPWPHLSETVLKFRRLDLLGQDSDRPLSVRTARRDLVMISEVSRLAQHYEVHEQGNWIHPISVVPLRSYPHALAEGIMVQSFVEGPSAQKIATTVFSSLTHQTPGSLRELQGWGFTSVNDALRKLALLEEFYFLTHHDVVHFERDNQLTILANRLVGDTTHTVGIDFNHGQNVIWSTQRRRWEIIDP